MDVCADMCHSRQRLRRHIALEAATDIGQHAAWENGLALSFVASALKPSLIDVEKNNDHHRAECKKMFGYDAEIKETQQASIPRRSCKEKHWGICKADALFPMITTMVHNTYATMQRWGLKKTIFPIVGCVKFEEVSCKMVAIVADTIGNGETVLLINLADISGSPGWYKLDCINWRKPLANCLTFQIALRSLLLQAGGERPGILETLQFFVFIWQSIRLHRRDKSLAIEVFGETKSGKLPLRVKLRAKGAMAAMPKLPLGLDLLAAHNDNDHDDEEASENLAPPLRFKRAFRLCHRRRWWSCLGNR